MACLFCGKDIGPIRLLRDSEFCSPKHRKQYKDRLQKVLVRVGEPETVPCGAAPFRDSLHAVAGRTTQSEAAFDFSSSRHRVKLPQAWSLEIPAVQGAVFSRFELSACDLTAQKPVPSYRGEAFPYFDSSAAGLLALPQPKLGAVVLRAVDGQLLSPPIALDCRTAAESPTPRSANPTSLARANDPVLPAFALSIAECEEIKHEAEPAPAETWMPTAVPEPAALAGEPSLSEPIAARADLHVPAGLPEPANQPARILDDFVTPPQPSESWMRRPPAEPVAPMMRPVAAQAAPMLLGLRLPGAISTPAASPRPEAHGAPLAGPEPKAAPMEARLSVPAVVPFPATLAAPGLQQFEISRAILPQGNPQWMQTAQSEPAVREVRPSAVETPIEFAAAPIRVAPLMVRPIDDLLETLVETTPAPSSPVRKMRLDARAAAPQAPTQPKVDPSAAPVRRQAGKSAASSPAVMPAAAGQPQTEVPQAGLVAIDYHCPAGPMVPQANLHWATPASSLQLNLPRFAVRPVFDRMEDQTPVRAPRKGPAFAEIFTMPDAAALTQRKAARHAFTAIAASVTVAMALWFGANAGKLGKDLINREVADEVASAARARAEGGSVEMATAQERPAQPAPSALSHPVAWVRNAAAKRATVQVADSFENGMAEWGAKGKSLVSGWSRSTDGYVRPGQLALFQPTVRYTDYRMEFFGQIEDRSMSWVVRGKDTKNYYAMKFNVVSPGLRPILSMTHYPVVGGKQGHKVETPLSVMVQNNMPYHVSVQVKGSHYTASIEGQEVDSWSDDTLLAGGVGFFSEAGARARIYWMKVSKNDDWFGRLCSRIAGDDGPRDTAWLDRPALPVPQPEPPAPAPAPAALGPAETAEAWYGKLQRNQSSWKGEIETWS